NDTTLCFQRLLIDCEAVILTSDLDPSRVEILYRLVSTSVAEFQFVSGRADRTTQELMAKADPEDRHLADSADERFDCVIEYRGIARAVGDEYTVGFVFEDLFCAHVRRNDGHLNAALGEMAENIRLSATVQCDDVQPIAAFHIAGELPVALSF